MINKTMIKVMAVDDDNSSLDLIESYVKKTIGLKWVCRVSNALHVVPRLLTADVNLLILDMEMPGLHGLDLLAQIKLMWEQPTSRKRSKLHVIVVSAHKNYAMDAFDYNVVHYLPKPLSYDGFLKAVERVRVTDSGASYRNEGPSEEYMLVRKGATSKKQLIRYDEVVYIKADNMECVLFFDQWTSYIVPKPMGYLQERLPADFKQCHRSYIINTSFVREVGPKTISLNGVTEEIPIGNRDLYKDFYFWELLNSIN